MCKRAYFANASILNRVKFLQATEPPNNVIITSKIIEGKIRLKNAFVILQKFKTSNSTQI